MSDSNNNNNDHNNNKRRIADELVEVFCGVFMWQRALSISAETNLRGGDRAVALVWVSNRDWDAPALAAEEVVRRDASAWRARWERASSCLDCLFPSLGRPRSRCRAA